MVSEINIKDKSPLHGQEEFLSCLNLHREGARFIFEQDIYRKADMKLCIQATVTVVSVVNGRLSKGDEIAFLLEDVQ